MRSDKNYHGFVRLSVHLYRDTEATIAVGDFHNEEDNKSYSITASSKRSPHDRRNRKLGDTLALARLFEKVAKQLDEDAAILEEKAFAGKETREAVISIGLSDMLPGMPYEFPVTEGGTVSITYSGPSSNEEFVDYSDLIYKATTTFDVPHVTVIDPARVAELSNSEDCL